MNIEKGLDCYRDEIKLLVSQKLAPFASLANSCTQSRYNSPDMQSNLFEISIY